MMNFCNYYQDLFICSQYEFLHLQLGLILFTIRIKGRLNSCTYNLILVLTVKVNSAVTTDTDLQCHRFMLADDKHSIEGIFYDIVSISPQYDIVVVIDVNVFHRSSALLTFSLNIVGSTDASGGARTAVQVRFKSHYFHVPRISQNISPSVNKQLSS